MTGAQAMTLVVTYPGTCSPDGPRYETVMTAKQDLPAGASRRGTAQSAGVAGGGLLHAKGQISLAGPGHD